MSKKGGIDAPPRFAALQNDTINESTAITKIIPKLGIKNSRPSRNNPSTNNIVAKTPASGIVSLTIVEG